ncbi:hypothetical protein SAMN05421666_2134 [Roseovarius nanhaiticus]|uniref:Tetratricopeptide repeat-like domain-containing protein n=1 Tax=Roseovarius nanhaiticus TaxID=573024 RepID=A0A1N7GW56_9RHOB|nr:hypothetical protein [Roseovarius nanhaiticus]SEL32002.1 hypothetical protein SAMN05216208_3434 [Roseovarius nanhaiticus]SIS16668.1 hypothetical protein SAMN05421666_2134 [Roseovarius nanhaiticus]
MSNSDSFIEEVSEEVRRDRLFGLMRRYGWIAVVLVLLIVGGAAYNEWRKAQERASAEALGDAMLAALETEERGDRAEALDAVTPAGPGSAAILQMMAAAEALEDDPAGAAERLMGIAQMSDIPLVYRQIATLKAVMIEEGGMDAETRRARLEDLALGGGVIRLLAEEQLAYLDIETGNEAGAIERMNAISADAGATPGLRRRATQVIVALGGEPQLPGGTEASVPGDAAVGAVDAGTAEGGE